MIVYHYSGTPDCDFVKYEACMLAGSLLVSIVLILGFILLLFQNLKTLRTVSREVFDILLLSPILYDILLQYLTGLLACSWLQLMINMVLTQTYPLVHEVHAKWAKSESLTSYEIKVSWSPQLNFALPLGVLCHSTSAAAPWAPMIICSHMGNYHAAASPLKAERPILCIPRAVSMWMEKASDSFTLS